MAGNDTQGLRYGMIETPEKYYLEWKEELNHVEGHKLDYHLGRMCNKQRFLQIIHDFIVFDAGVKKLADIISFSVLKLQSNVLPNERVVLFGIPKGQVKV
jgi:type I site-specific restriction-modification system R (restriction) subunit